MMGQVIFYFSGFIRYSSPIFFSPCNIYNLIHQIIIKLKNYKLFYIKRTNLVRDKFNFFCPETKSKSESAGIVHYKIMNRK